ncbi:Beta-1,4-endoglucanase [Meloidogyne graminicola]|uniref:Beta-1,4-endoglucanase n=1 Tax=Meloidogyne graminicola TaxID=189291 RepID=A0A8S9ZFE2_9BILA|nr:Beta-1,4-endoglucanase [Meloidogyne graminicola]
MDVIILWIKSDLGRSKISRQKLLSVVYRENLLSNKLIREENRTGKIEMFKQQLHLALPAANPPYGKLSVRNGQLKGSNDQVATLRGISLWFSQWITEFYSPGVVRAIKCFYNGNVVRASIGTCCSGYLENPSAAINAATTIGDAAIANGMYFIIDWHDVANQKCNNDADFNNFINSAIKFFTTIINKYKGSPNILLELWNEPAYTCSWAKLKQYYNAVLTVLISIRKIDPNVVVILGTPKQSTGPSDEVINSPVVGANLMYALHFYCVPYQQHIENQKQMILKAKSKGFATFVSEYGDADATPPAPLQPAAMKAFWQFMDQNQLSYAKWSLTNKDEVYSLMVPWCSASQAFQESCLSASGKLLREHMWSLNNGINGC